MRRTPQVAYVRKGESPKALGGGSTLLSSAQYGPIATGSGAAGSSAPVLYSLKVTATGSYIAAHSKSGDTKPAFTTAFKVPAGASDLDVF